MQQQESLIPPGPSIDWVMLADAAEAVNGKVYVIGGGFTVLGMANFALPHRCAMAASFRIPWSHTNRRLPVSCHLETIDGERLDGWAMSGEVEAGRAAGMRGEDGIAIIAGPVEIKVDGPVDLVLKTQFAQTHHSYRFKVVKAGAGPMQIAA